jgi:hypothetical protein
MSEHSPASTSQFSSIRSEPTGQQERSTEMLTRQAREQVSQAGEYLASKTQEYPFGALLIAGLIGYGIGYLIHTSWSGEPQQRTSAPMGHSGDVLRPLEYRE